MRSRKSIRLKNYNYSKEGIYFVTICTYNNQKIFGQIKDEIMILNEYGKIAHKCWLNIPVHYPNVILDKFVIMPDHIHGIIQIFGFNILNPKITVNTGNRINP